jgi:hypothetical protein
MIYGLECGPLPDEWQAMEAISMVKCLVPEGKFSYQWSLRATEGLHIVEAIGALEAALFDLKNDYLKMVNGDG